MPLVNGETLRHIIFDLDGTLADTAKATIPALHAVASRNGLPRVSDQSVRSAMGYANPEFYRRLYPGIPHALLTTIAAEAEAAEEDVIRTLGRAILFPGIEPLLAALTARGIILHIASTGDVPHVNATLESAGIKSLFASISCAAPEKAAMVAKIIGAQGREAFALVGDKCHDLNAARENNIPAIAAVYGYCAPADAADFDHALNAPGELIALLKG